MNPENNQQNTQPMTSQSPITKSRSVIPLVLIGLFATVAVVTTVLFFMTSSKLTKTEGDLKTASQRIDEVSKELEGAQRKIAQLDNPERKDNDQLRKTHLITFVAALNEYAQNHQGKYPTTEPTAFKEEFVDAYLQGPADFTDPNTKERYTITPVATVQTPPGLVLGDIQYQWPGTCAGSEFSDDATERQAAARILLESGETDCLDA